MDANLSREIFDAKAKKLRLDDAEHHPTELEVVVAEPLGIGLGLECLPAIPAFVIGSHMDLEHMAVSRLGG
jgi:hypothetical protein